MGTYTANKELYMPSIGEQGWGELMNTNLSTIDTFLKPITVSGSTYTFTGNQTGGSISATSITNSGTLTSTGKITANGGIGTTTLTASSTSTFTGKITANGGIGTKALTTTSISNSGTLTQTGTSTFTGKITANGGVNDYEERISEIEDHISFSPSGDIIGNLSGNLDLSNGGKILIPYDPNGFLYSTTASLSMNYSEYLGVGTYSYTDYYTRPETPPFVAVGTVSTVLSDTGSYVRFRIEALEEDGTHTVLYEGSPRTVDITYDKPIRMGITLTAHWGFSYTQTAKLSATLKF